MWGPSYENDRERKPKKKYCNCPCHWLNDEPYCDFCRLDHTNPARLPDDD